MNRKTATMTAITTALGLLAFTGCAPSLTPAPADPSAQEAAQDVAEEAPEPTPEPTPEGQGVGEGLFKLGETAEYEDGLALTAEVVGKTTLSDVGSADCAYGDAVTVVEMTIENGTDATVHPWEDMTSPFAQYEDSDEYAVTAADVFDNADYNGGYDLSAGQEWATLRPGQKGSALYGYCTPDMAEDSFLFTIDPTSFEEMDSRDPLLWNATGTY